MPDMALGCSSSDYSMPFLALFFDAMSGVEKLAHFLDMASKNNARHGFRLLFHWLFDAMSDIIFWYHVCVKNLTNLHSVINYATLAYNPSWDGGISQCCTGWFCCCTGLMACHKLRTKFDFMQCRCLQLKRFHAKVKITVTKLDYVLLGFIWLFFLFMFLFTCTNLFHPKSSSSSSDQPEIPFLFSLVVQWGLVGFLPHPHPHRRGPWLPDTGRVIVVYWLVG